MPQASGRHPRRMCAKGSGALVPLLLLAWAACDPAPGHGVPPGSGQGRDATEQTQPPGDEYAGPRRRLVKKLRGHGIDDEAVLAAIGRVPRHRMVPEDERRRAYADMPLPIGHDQTISQPYVVAVMSQLADIQPGEKVLEVGTGSGYQAAVLAELGAEVYSIEILAPLAKRARRTLDALGYRERIHTRTGDGYAGWPDRAPFDAIVITAAPPKVPQPLIDQLAVGGKLVAPVGRVFQELVVITMTPQGPVRQRSIGVRFVPMTGKAQQ